MFTFLLARTRNNFYKLPLQQPNYTRLIGDGGCNTMLAVTEFRPLLAWLPSFRVKAHLCV